MCDVHPARRERENDTVTLHRTLRFTPLAASLVLIGALCACNRHDTTTGNTEPLPPTATLAPPAGATVAPAGGAATTTDNTAMPETTGTDAGTVMDNTAQGTTAGDMSTSRAATPATTGAPPTGTGTSRTDANGNPTSGTNSTDNTNGTKKP
jgi:hypothetical protein